MDGRKGKQTHQAVSGHEACDMEINQITQK
jgi:hypothetical protein